MIFTEENNKMVLELEAILKCSELVEQGSVDYFKDFALDTTYFAKKGITLTDKTDRDEVYALLNNKIEIKIITPNGGVTFHDISYYIRDLHECLIGDDLNQNFCFELIKNDIKHEGRCDIEFDFGKNSAFLSYTFNEEDYQTDIKTYKELSNIKELYDTVLNELNKLNDEIKRILDKYQFKTTINFPKITIRGIEL